MARKSKVVTATGTATTARAPGLAQKIEAAMTAAIEQCAKDGITQPAKIKKAMLAARKQVKADG